MNEKFQKKLDSIIEDIFIVDNFKEYLLVCSKFYHMPYYNQALIYNQKPESTYLAGLSTWKNKFSRDIKEDEKPILILFPKKIENNMEFDIGVLFDISQTIGGEIEFDEEFDIEDILRKKEFLLAPSKMDKNATNKRFMVNVDEKTIYYDDTLKEEEYIKTLLIAYVDYKFQTAKCTFSYEKHKQQAANFVICNAFGIEDNYTRFVFINKLKKESSLEDLKDFLDDISLIVLEIMRDLVGNFVSFEEVSFMNHLLDYKKDALISSIDNLDSTDNYLDGRMHDIKDKIMELNEENFNRIQKDRNEYKLISFPFYYY